MKNSTIKFNVYTENEDLGEAGVYFSRPAGGRYQAQGLRMTTFKTREMDNDTLRKYGLYERYGKADGS